MDAGTVAPPDASRVDYAGATFEVIDPKTGEVGTAQLFVATCGVQRWARRT